MKNRYTIGEVSQLSGLTPKTLRFYDRTGILHPEFRDEHSGYRYYSRRQLTTLTIIHKYRDLDFSLKSIQSILSNKTVEETEQLFHKHNLELQEEILRLKNIQEESQKILSRLQEGIQIRQKFPEITEGNTPCHIEKIPAGRMFFTRKIMRNYHNELVNTDRWIELFQKLSDYKLHTYSPVILTYHDEIMGQFLMKDCDVEFGILVSNPPEEGDLSTAKPPLSSFRDWGGFNAVVAYHIGDSATIVNTHIKLVQWVYSHDYEISGPISDQYIISPLDVDQDNLQLTKVIVPIADE